MRGTLWRRQVLVAMIFLVTTISSAFACTHGKYQCQAGIKAQCTCDKHGCIWKDTGNKCSSDDPATN